MTLTAPKKAIAIIMAACLSLAMMPASAWGAGAEGKQAKIGTAATSSAYGISGDAKHDAESGAESGANGGESNKASSKESAGSDDDASAKAYFEKAAKNAPDGSNTSNDNATAKKNNGASANLATVRTVNLTIKPAFPKGVKLSWNTAPEDVACRVIRATEGSNVYTVLGYPATNSYTDTTAAGRSYVYRIEVIYLDSDTGKYVLTNTPATKPCAGKWVKSGSTKKFKLANGAYAKSWQLINGKWYYFQSSGKMLKSSFKTVSKKKYYLGSNGAMKKGWVSKSGKKYYMTSSGAAAKGWTVISNREYFFSKSTCAMAKNKYVNGKYLNSKGVWTGKIKIGKRTGAVTATKALLSKVNAARKKVGSKSLKWDVGLEQTAKQRALEIRRYFSHTRPNGKMCFSIFPTYLGYMGENIAMGQRSVAAVNTAWTNSPGHYANMIESNFNVMGAACFTYGGVKYWVELFGSK